MTKYAIIDLETTGLNPDTGSILEVSALIVDSDLNEIDRYSSLVEPIESYLEYIDDFVYDMHKKNGLWDEIAIAARAGSLRHAGAVQHEFYDFLCKYNDGKNTNLYLVGNSIPSLDLPFIRKYMPKALEAVHYRTIDVTAMRLGMALLTGIDLTYLKTKGHRGMADCLECLAELRFMKEKIPDLLSGYQGIYLSVEEAQALRNTLECALDVDMDPYTSIKIALSTITKKMKA